MRTTFHNIKSLPKKLRSLFRFRKVALFSACLAVTSVAFSQQSMNNDLATGESIQKSISLSQAVPQAEKRLSFNFQEISTRSLLQLIAQNAGLNFVISEGVKGQMTLSLQDVTWQQALDIVLKANALGYRRYDNVILVAPIEELATNEVKQLQAEQQIANLAPLSSQVIHLNYASASDVASMLKGSRGNLLTDKGEVTYDTRTNSLLIKETQANISDVSQFVRQLDIPAKQVLIEARIVSVDTSYVEQLGVKFGLNNAHNNLGGNLNTANSLQAGNSIESITPSNRLNFSLPASTVQGQNAGTLGLALMRIGGTYLDLELSALEGEHHGQIISSPRVITSNQQKAYIETGEEIPYQEATSSGATSVAFKKAILSLEIIPQITPDGHIVLNLKVTQDKRGLPTTITSAVTPTASSSSDSAPQTTTVSTSIPAIDTQEVQSNVLLTDGETIVLGGVYKQTKENTVQRIPFLGSLPVIGALFTHKGIDNQRTELLIFITPKIINQASDWSHILKAPAEMNEPIKKTLPLATATTT